jgi:hypothetical protein
MFLRFSTKKPGKKQMPEQTNVLTYRIVKYWVGFPSTIQLATQVEYQSKEEAEKIVAEMTQQYKSRVFLILPDRRQELLDHDRRNIEI